MMDVAIVLKNGDTHKLMNVSESLHSTVMHSYSTGANLMLPVIGIVPVSDIDTVYIRLRDLH